MILPYCKFCITRKTLCSKYCRFMVIRNKKKNKYLLGRKYRHLISMFHWFAPTQLFRENAKSGFITDENYCKLMIDLEIWCFGGGRNPSEFTLSFSFTLQQIEEQVHTDWTVLPHNTLSISSLRACVYLYKYQAISLYCMNSKGKKMKGLSFHQIHEFHLHMLKFRN